MSPNVGSAPCTARRTEAEAAGGESEELKKKMEQLDMDTKEDKLFLSQTEYIKRMVCIVSSCHDRSLLLTKSQNVFSNSLRNIMSDVYVKHGKMVNVCYH